MHAHAYTYLQYLYIEHKCSQLCRVSNVQNQDKQRYYYHSNTCRSGHVYRLRQCTCTYTYTLRQCISVQESAMNTHSTLLHTYTRGTTILCRHYNWCYRTASPETPSYHWDRNHTRNLCKWGKKTMLIVQYDLKCLH